MRGVEREPGADAAEYPRARRAYEEGGAGVVREAEQPRALRGRQRAALHEPGRRGRAQRIAAEHSREQRRRARPGQAEEPAHRRGEPAREPLRHAELAGERAQYEEGEERGDYALRREREAPPHALGRRGRPDKQRRERGREGRRAG